MNLGSKLLPGSIVALFLGVFLATPLLYTNIVVAPVVASSTGLFDVDVVYAYVEEHNQSMLCFQDVNGTVIEPRSFTDPEGYWFTTPMNITFFVTTQNITNVSHYVAINFTLLSEEGTQCDAKTEIFLLSFSSQEGLIGSEQTYRSVVYNESVQLPVFDVFDQRNFNDGEIVSGTGGILDTGTDNSWLCSSSSTGNSWVPTFGSPEYITLSIERLGSFTVTGDSKEHTVLSEPQVVTEVTLNKYGTGFLYNTIIPDSEINSTDLRQPPMYRYYVPFN
ncbi:MAG: hypothetical protein NWF03_00335 [Candidatus Bathyarchaeota archaeon]|nr:hypothetical protein [Candidatus Bathyarchaeota archaeon]